LVVGGGDQALEVLRRDCDFDVLLCDLMMPSMDGLTFYREVAQSWPSLAERFIFVTGGAFTSRMSDFVAKIGNRVLEKPVPSKRLKRVIDGMCKSRHKQGRN
ncbi:MAG: response regulator, partial [Myxococcota bacterium]